jgi:hypothetical protein
MKPLRTVFCIVPDCHSSGHYSRLWRRHFYNGLEDVVEALLTPVDTDFSWARSPQPAPAEAVSALRTQTSERLWEQIRAAREERGIDAVISYAFSQDFDLELVERTTKSGVPWINFYCDSTHRFPEVAELARRTSLNWFPEHAAVDRYREVGAASFCRPFALNPKHLPDLSLDIVKRRVAFIGVPSANRITQLGILRCLGVKAEIRGHGWRESTADVFYNAKPARKRLWQAIRQRGLGEKAARRLLWPIVRRQAEGPLDEAEFAGFVQTTEVVLGLNQGRDGEGRFQSYMKFRDLEFPGYGCCYLTERNPDIESAFEIGKEILATTTLREMAGVIRELARSPDRIRAIGLAGRRRVLSDHTWFTRLRELEARL